MASIQLDLAIPNFLIQEFLIDHPPEVERLFAEPFTWLPGGWVEPPSNPGLGVELDWDAIRAHEQLPYTRTYQPSLWHVDGSVADW
jgi:galactonate dehydratase